MKKLPPNDYPIYTFEIPSTKEQKRFRPFLVKEQKALLIAQGSDDTVVMTNTLKSIVNSCCVDEIDADKLAIFDLEFLLLKLRSVSVSSNAEVIVQCDGDHKDAPESSYACNVEVDMSTLEVVGIKEDKLIKLSENKAVLMKYPPIDILNIIGKTEELAVDDGVKLVAMCLKEIIVNDEVFTMEDLDQEDIFNWLNTLDNESFEKIIEFVNDFPFTRIKVEWTCPFCGKHNERYLVGLESFF